jgi:hypothetical protein
MPLFLLMCLKAKLVAHLFWVLLVCSYPVDISETTLLLLRILTSMSVPKPHVFLLSVQFVRALTCLVNMELCLWIIVSFLIKIFSPFFCIFSVFNCILLCFSAFL